MTTIIAAASLATLAAFDIDSIVVNATGVATLDRANLTLAIQQCVSSGKTLIMMRDAATIFRLDQPLVIQPTAPETSVKLNVKGVSPGLMPLVAYLGPDNTNCFVTRGLKFSTWTDVSVQTGAKNSNGFAVNTYGAFQSSSYVTFDHCRVVIQAAGAGGWSIGPDGSGAADISGISWRSCSVSGGNLGRYGWSMTGGNTLNLSWYDCFADHLTDYGWQFWPLGGVLSTSGGGSASSLYNCGAGWGLGFVKMQGGFELGVYSGRSEQLTGPVFWAGSGGGVGFLNVFGHKTGACPTFSRADGPTPINIYP
ncbi:MAG: hypothetical protein JSS65_14920 [Armatimonadetes bacterium]|nr:hypothetical protein [Armatimonadota bacterium]